MELLDEHKIVEAVSLFVLYPSRQANVLPVGILALIKNALASCERSARISSAILLIAHGLHWLTRRYLASPLVCIAPAGRLRFRSIRVHCPKVCFIFKPCSQLGT